MDPPHSGPRDRKASIDVFRGLAVIGMILVTNPGSYATVYPALLHAEWNGWTPADMIFPSFLFAAGMALTFSLRSRMVRGDTAGKLVVHVCRRSGLLLVIGLALNAFPRFDLETLRLPGVLQRIALCYFCGALLYLACDRLFSREPRRAGRAAMVAIASVTLALLAGYWALLKAVPVPGFGAGRLDSLGNLPAYLDRRCFGIRHLWPWGLTPSYGVTYDPEGLLSTLPAIATLLSGVLAGEWLRSVRPDRVKILVLGGVGVVALVLGMALDPLMPINKRLWTSTFVLFSDGVALLSFAVCSGIAQSGWGAGWTWPARVFGSNALLSFVLASVLTSLLDLVHLGGGASIGPTSHEWGYRSFARALTPYNASLAYAIAIVVPNLVLMSWWYRRRLFVRF